MNELSKMTTAKTTSKSPADYLKLPYARVLIPAEEGGFFAEILEFSGCFAEGETPNEAFDNLEKAAESWIEAAFEQGQDIPPPSANEKYSGRVALRLPRDLHRQVAYKAQRDGVSINQCLVTAVAAWVGADNVFERIAQRIEATVEATIYQTNVIQIVATATNPFPYLLTSGTALSLSHPSMLPVDYSSKSTPITIGVANA